MSNAKKARPGIEIELGGETLTLIFDLWALVEVERKTGKTVSDLLSTGSMEGILVMLWASLQNRHSDLTEEDVGHMIDLQNISVISETLGRALSNSAPAEKKGGAEKNAKGQPPKSGTGSSSGQSDVTTSD